MSNNGRIKVCRRCGNELFGRTPQSRTVEKCSWCGFKVQLRFLERARRLEKSRSSIGKR